MISSFNMAFDPGKLVDLLISAGLSVLVMLIACLVAGICFPKTEGVQKFAVVFNNCGFMGIPLVEAILGLEAVFYLTVLMAVWNLFAWIYGRRLLGESGRMDIRKVILNPATVSIVIGLCIFFWPGSLSEVFSVGLNYLGSMNTPLGMLVLGAYLYNCSWDTIRAYPSVWKICLFRLVLIPALTILAFWILPASISLIRYTMIIAAVTPTGATIAMFCRMLHRDTSLAALSVSLTTLCSLVTIPVMLAGASLLYSL